MNSRKAISTIVGSVFFLVLLTSGLSVSYMVIETQSDMIEAQQTIADSEIKKIQEKFDFSAATDVTDNNRLELYVQNDGSNPLEIDTLWVIDNTSNDAQKYSVNYADAVLSSGYGSEILQNTPLYLSPGDYDIKVVSALGTVKTTKLEVDGISGGSDLKIKVMVDPPDVRVGENATAWVFVTNTGATNLLDVTAEPMTVAPLSAVVSSSPVLQYSTDLAPSESAIFSWEYTITGPIGSDVTFSTYATGMREGSTPVQSDVDQGTITLRDNLDSISDVLTDELFGRPEVFMIIPSPFGDSSQKGLWGVNVVNPTSQPIYVNKVVINAVSPRNQAQDQIFDTNGCSPITIAPTPSSWSCPATNQLMWKNTVTPQVVPPKSVFPFLVKVTPGTLGGATIDLETVLVQTNVFTTLGQFGKAGYGSSFRNGGSSVPNVYLSAIPESVNDNHIKTNMTAIKAGTPITFNATIADFDTGLTHVISSGSKLIVNIPKSWTNVSVLSNNGFSTPVFYQSFPDGSSQLVGTLNGDITGAGGIARTIKFTATAPTISDTQMYVMYILAEGDVSGSFQIGPLAEIVLQVVP
jgi:hypothetical protein